MALEVRGFSDFDYFLETCISCNESKPIPIIRSSKKCDECLESEFEKQSERQKEIETERRLIWQRVPKRYWDFDIKNFEISEDDFIKMTKPGKSYAISGDHGTGKTNLACQILKYSCRGSYFFVSDLFKYNLDKIRDINLMVIDDISKLDLTNNKKLEIFFEMMNYRYAECLDTIVTIDRTYTDLEKLFGDYGLPLVGRLRQWMIGITLTKKWR